MPVSGGATSLPMSPSLWQTAHAAAKSALPFTASPGCSTTGVNCAINSARFFAFGLSLSIIAAACLATCLFGCVRRRAMLPGPRSFGSILPSRMEFEQRERGFGTLQDRVEGGLLQRWLQRVQSRHQRCCVAALVERSR